MRAQSGISPLALAAWADADRLKEGVVERVFRLVADIAMPTEELVNVRNS